MVVFAMSSSFANGLMLRKPMSDINRHTFKNDQKMVILLSNTSTLTKSSLAGKALEKRLKLKSTKNAWLIPSASDHNHSGLANSLKRDFGLNVKIIDPKIQGWREKLNAFGVHGWNSRPNVDVIITPGGAVGKLNKALHDSGANKLIQELVTKDKTVYIGASAGGIVTGKHTWGKDTRPGMNLLPQEMIFFPHEDCVMEDPNANGQNKKRTAVWQRNTSRKYSKVGFIGLKNDASAVLITESNGVDKVFTTGRDEMTERKGTF